MSKLRKLGSLIAALVAAYSLSKWIPSIQKYLKIRRAVSQLPHPPLANLLMGNTDQVPKDKTKQAENFLNMSKKYGSNGAFGFFLGPIPIVMAVSPEVVKIVLGTSRHTTKGDLYFTLWPWLGTGLLTSEGAKWKGRRRMITPTFHFDILKRFLEVMNEQTDVLINKMEEKSKTGNAVEAFDLITLCALDIICETAMGKPINAQGSEGKNEYVEAVYRSSTIVIDRPLKPWNLSDWIFKYSSEGKESQKVLKILHGFSRKVIQERKILLAEEKAKFGESESDQKSRPAFLDILLSARDENGRPLDDEDIREEVDTFMFEGHDTTSASLAWTLQLLGRHPEVQKAVHEEVDAVMGESKDVTYDMLSEFKYLDMVLKESLRVYPSVPFIGRALTEDTMINGILFPQGTQVNVQINALHHNPLVWEEPERFDPLRWANDSEERDPYKYIPFSAGPRNCVGQKFAQNEEKVVIAKIMKSFSIKALNEKVPSYPELILEVESGGWGVHSCCQSDPHDERKELMDAEE